MQLQRLSLDALEQRFARLDALMAENKLDTLVINDNANLYYLTGRVFCGYIIYRRDSHRLVSFVRRPNNFIGDNVVAIRKAENIIEHLDTYSLAPLGRTAIELDNNSYSTTLRLAAALGLESFENANVILRAARSVKCSDEIALLEASGQRHEQTYRKIPSLYRKGMSDIELQIEIERTSRMDGCLGLFRISGKDMELFMGNILTGDNADAPSPYDFAMGGAGADPSLPVGADGSPLSEGHSLMVDVNGNYTGYMTDMTRCFAIGKLPDEAMRAHQLSIDICQSLAEMGRPGVEARALFEQAARMVEEAGMQDYFMGHRQHAGFVGHGVGIEINEMPVIAPRSRDILAAGNVIALEPKFVIPGVGAVGIENTYLVMPEGPMQCLTNAPSAILPLGAE